MLIVFTFLSLVSLPLLVQAIRQLCGWLRFGEPFPRYVWVDVLVCAGIYAGEMYFIGRMMR